MNCYSLLLVCWMSENLNFIHQPTQTNNMPKERKLISHPLTANLSSISYLFSFPRTVLSFVPSNPINYNYRQSFSVILCVYLSYPDSTSAPPHVLHQHRLS